MHLRVALDLAKLLLRQGKGKSAAAVLAEITPEFVGAPPSPDLTEAYELLGVEANSAPIVRGLLQE